MIRDFNFILVQLNGPTNWRTGCEAEGEGRIDALTGIGRRHGFHGCGISGAREEHLPTHLRIRAHELLINFPAQCPSTPTVSQGTELPLVDAHIWEHVVLFETCLVRNRPQAPCPPTLPDTPG